MRPEDLGRLMRRAEPDAIAEFLAQSNVDGTVVMAVPHHGYCTHTTRIGERFPGLAGDWFGAMVEALHERGIAVFGYVTINWNWKYIREHAGAPYIHGTPEAPGMPGNRMMICLNAPGYLDLVAAYTDEVVRQYPVDGMRWDILKTARGCRCEGCVALYRERTGCELPAPGMTSGDWELDLYDWTIERAARRLYETVKSAKPEVPAWHNHLSPYFPNPVDLVREMDIGYNEYGSPARLIILRGISGRAAAIHGLMNQTPSDPPQPLDRREWWTALALGGRCYSYYGHRHTDPETLLPDSSFRRWHREQLSPFYAEVAQAQPWLEGLRPQSDLGLVFCDATRRRWKDRDRARYLSVLEPIVDELLKRNRPPVVIHASDLGDPGVLGPCSTLVLPLTSGLSAAQLDALRAFVRAGGTVVVAGDALRHSLAGEELDEFVLATELGVSWRGVRKASPTTQWVGPWKAKWGEQAADPVYRLEEFCAVAARAGDTLLALKDCAENWPLIHVRYDGAGRWAWLAFTTPPPFVAQVIEEISGRPLVRILDGDANVFCSTRTDRHGHWVLHLIGRGPVRLQLDVRRISARRLVSVWPREGWRAVVRQATGALELCVEGGGDIRILELA